MKKMQLLTIILLMNTIVSVSASEKSHTKTERNGSYGTFQQSMNPPKNQSPKSNPTNFMSHKDAQEMKSTKNIIVAEFRKQSNALKSCMAQLDQDTNDLIKQLERKQALKEQLQDKLERLEQDVKSDLFNVSSQYYPAKK